MWSPCLPQTSQEILHLAPVYTLFTQKEAGLGPSVFKSSPWDMPHLQLYLNGPEVSHMDTQPVFQRHCLAEGPQYLEPS